MILKYWKFESQSKLEIIPIDTFFELHETEELKGLVNLCIENKENFQIYFEVFDDLTQDILTKETVTNYF